MRLGRFDDAVAARRKAIALNGDTPAREADLGEALGRCRERRRDGGGQAASSNAPWRADQHEAKARYFLGLADEQDGNRDAAAAKWRALLDDAPPNAPWVNFVRAALARVTGAPVAANEPKRRRRRGRSDNMNDEQRVEMIRGMVQRLADRLHIDGNDVRRLAAPGSRLCRARRSRQGEGCRFRREASARRAVRTQVKQIDDLVKDLGIEG